MEGDSIIARWIPLESNADRAKLAVTEQYLAEHRHELLIVFWRTSAGAEIDLLLEWPGGELWAIEIKRSLAPKLERGFHAACEDLQPARRMVVHPGDTVFPLSSGTEAVPLTEAMLRAARRDGA